MGSKFSRQMLEGIMELAATSNLREWLRNKTASEKNVNAQALWGCTIPGVLGGRWEGWVCRPKELHKIGEFLYPK